MDIQFSLTGVDGWVTVTTVQAGVFENYRADATVDQPAAGYWRAHYPGQVDWFQPATSPAIFVP